MKPLATIRCSRLCDKNSCLMLSNPLASSSLPKRELLNLPCILRHKCSNGTMQNFCEIQSLPFSGLLAKFCSSCSSKKETLITSQKILQTEVHKVWRKWGFFCAIWPILLRQTQSKPRYSKMFILTLMLYCTSKSCKIQVAKVATKWKC